MVELFTFDFALQLLISINLWKSKIFVSLFAYLFKLEFIIVT